MIGQPCFTTPVLNISSNPPIENSMKERVKEWLTDDGYSLEEVDNENTIWAYTVSEDSFEFGVAEYLDSPGVVTITTKVDLTEYESSFFSLPANEQRDIIFS